VIKKTPTLNNPKLPWSNPEGYGLVISVSLGFSKMVDWIIYHHKQRLMGMQLQAWPDTWQTRIATFLSWD
jgi:hypothetical protein